ncbi:MAG: ARMT1-like domain-containing protein [Candidatus Omnitrophica bacterium]|nr:ARMT1-like domain-containing protein [Candidatus Omnitrophota bacterium]
MKTQQECIPCFMRQAIDAAKLAGADIKIQKKVLDKVALVLPTISFDATPPEIAEKVYAIVGEYVGGDAYKKIKKMSNKRAMELYPKLKRTVARSREKLLTAVRLAVAGNVIDYGVPYVFDIDKEIALCLKKDFAIFDYEKFAKKLKKAKKVLYILDNAGEIVFDKVLIEEMDKDVICAVREKPIINDVTREDAVETGLEKRARVISSGSTVPGTVVTRCFKEFKKIFNDADLIISKGQGNFETLSASKKPIFFIFKAKCPVVATCAKCGVGDIILKG